MSGHRHRLRRAPALALPAALLLAACPEPAPSGPPCEDDLTACDDDTSAFVEDPSCELTGELDLQLGEGEDAFSPLLAGEMPQLYTGFQGGQHVWLGVQVRNADLTRPQLKIRVSMRMCDTGCEDPANWQTDSVRELVAGAQALEITDATNFELSSVLIQVFNWNVSGQRGIDMLVTDPCGRQGLIMQRSP